MKKARFVLAAMILASFAFFTACTKDTTPPSMNFKGGSGYTSDNVTIDAGSALKFGINASSGSSKLSGFTLKATHNNITVTVIDSAFSSDSFNQDYTLEIWDEGETRLAFTITDKDGETAELAIVVTANAVDDINAYSEVLLGSYDNSTYGSSFASADGTVYKIADAKANSTKIDWLYFYGVSNQATLAAPDDADAATIFTGTNGLPSWATRNATRFRLVTEGAVWDNIATSADITAIATSTTESKVNQLAVGNIVAFKTAGNKLGLIKITEITGTGAGTIKYDVKVQK